MNRLCPRFLNKMLAVQWLHGGYWFVKLELDASIWMQIRRPRCLLHTWETGNRKGEWVNLMIWYSLIYSQFTLTSKCNRILTTTESTEYWLKRIEHCTLLNFTDHANPVATSTSCNLNLTQEKGSDWTTWLESKGYDWQLWPWQDSQECLIEIHMMLLFHIP